MFDPLVRTLLNMKAVLAVKYLSEKEIVRARRTCYQGRLPRKGSNLEFTVTHGKPNYEERQFIKKLKKAGEPFPVKKIQLKFPKGS
jgi:hypothetical protein